MTNFEFFKLNMSNRINYIMSELEDQYLMGGDSLRPWINGFSGGKDPAALLQLVWLALKNIPAELRNQAGIAGNNY
jgi:DNA sulfur modification protein DndC